MFAAIIFHFGPSLIRPELRAQLIGKGAIEGCAKERQVTSSITKFWEM